MVRPVDFHKAISDVVKNNPEEVSRLHKQSIVEWENAVEKLRGCGVRVVALDHAPAKKPDELKPQAVWCNNWCTTHPDGTVIVYPMAHEERRRETHLMHAVQDACRKEGFNVRNLIRIGALDEDKYFLEGTGSMVFEHSRRLVYCCKSSRTSLKQLNNFLEVTRHFKDVVLFESNDDPDLEGDKLAKASTLAADEEEAVYHTDLIMAIGDKFAVLGTGAIRSEPSDRRIFATCAQVRDTLMQFKDVIELSREQVVQGCCGNILQVKSAQTQEPVIVMSSTAHDNFTEEQRTRLKKHGKLCVIDISTLEKYGGGSARCMLMECFLPRDEDPYDVIDKWLPEEAFEEQIPEHSLQKQASFTLAGMTFLPKLLEENEKEPSSS